MHSIQQPVCGGLLQPTGLCGIAVAAPHRDHLFVHTPRIGGFAVATVLCTRSLRTSKLSCHPALLQAGCVHFV